MNYFDILLAKKLRGGGGGDITIKSLNVTQNGTYSEEGVAYSPVKVNVPLPENAYLLKEIENVEIASFNDGSDLPMLKLEVAIEPQQEGSGDPSPENVRPIIGWDEVNVGDVGKNLLDPTIQKYSKPFIVYGGTIASNVPDGSLVLTAGTYTISINKNMSTIEVRDNPNSIINTGQGNSLTFTLEEEKAIKIAINIGSADIDSLTFQLERGSTATDYEPYNGQTITLDLDGTRYGGKVDLVSGMMTVDRAYVDLGTLDYTYYSGNLFTVRISDLKPVPNEVLCDALCSIYVTKKGNEYSSIDGSFVAGFNNARTLAIHDSRFADATAFKQAMNGVQLVYELATPLTIQLSPTVVKSLRGMNNVFADTGNILDLSYLAKEE